MENEYTIKSSVPPDILTITPNGEEIIRIDSTGRIFWNQREVTTDDDFRKAMLVLAEKLIN